MNYKKIEDLFIDFILNKIGPIEEREIHRNNSLSKIKKIMVLEKRAPDYTIHVKSYGSFPIKTYLKDAYIDITIFFELKKDKVIKIGIKVDLIDKILKIIKEEFEKHNRESNMDLISDIRKIKANIRLLKCKIGGINIDISINNFSGLYQILFIDYIEKQLEIQFNENKLFNDTIYKDNKINIFRRTLLLIKGWLFYEGELMGSNIGVMACYTLEILVIFLFNLHYNEIKKGFEAFEKFFELINQFNWDKNLVSFYGIISEFNFFKKLEYFNDSVLNEKEKK